MIIVTINLILSLGFFGQSFHVNDSKLYTYFEALENKEYRKAKELAKTFDNEDLAGHLEYISDLLFYNGTKELKKPKKFSKYEFESDFYKSIHFLSLGVSELKLNYRNDESFGFLISALDYADRSEIISLRKFCLISILELYKKEILLSNDQYKVYLNDLKSINENVEDELRCELYEVMFYAKTIESKIDDKYFQIFESIDSKIGEIDSNHPLWINYFLRSGIRNQIQGNLINAEQDFLNGLENIKNGDEPYKIYAEFEFTIKLAQNYTLKGDFTTADRYFKISRKLLSPNRISKDNYLFFFHFANYLKDLGEWEEAYLAFQEHANIGHELDYRGNTLEIAQKNVQFDTAKKEKQILLEQQKALANRNWLIAASLALLLGTGIAVLLQKNTSKKRQLAEQEAVLKQQRVENLLKEQELVSIDAMIAGQEKERQRVAGELHDDLGSLMATIKLHFDNAKVSKQDPALKNAQNLLEEAYQKIRGMAHSKNSGVMSDQGLLAAIKKMAKTITETDALNVTVEDFGLGERLENSLELSIFRMVQELVANAIKHAEASKVNIQLTQHEDNLNIIVEDNGKGFERSKLNKDKSGMGLTTIEKRVEHLEGNFTVDSIVGKGTSILIDIPV